MNKEIDFTDEKQEHVKTRSQYSPPEIRNAGAATTLIQGCGGGGQDRNYYTLHICG